MSEAKSSAEIILQSISLPSTFDEQDLVIKTLQEQFKQVDHSSKLDEATKGMGKPASLLNFYLATSVNLSWIGLPTPAVYFPVMITEREGGRKSLYDLEQNEEVLTGIYVTSEGIALRFVKRVTGNSLPPEVGDEFSTRMTNRAGQSVFEGQAKLQSFDPKTGEGHFVPSTAAGTSPDVSSFSLFWSLILYQPDQWG